MRNWIKNGTLQMLVIAVTTAVGAEFKITPFADDSFRVGLGVSIFLLFLLFMRHLPFVTTGIVTGMIVVVFFQHNAAAGLYYVVFAYGMSMVRKRIDDIQPFLLGGLVAGIDFMANVTELLLRALLLGTNSFHLEEWLLLAGIAVVRSYFVIGLYTSISITQLRSLHAEQEKRIKQMLNVGSGLYGEVFYLRKSMDNIEDITLNSYGLYRRLKEDRLTSYSQNALEIVQRIHEVKKDSQRILAGLLKLVDSETVVDMQLAEIIRYVIKGNQEYGEMLQKQIKIEKEVGVSLVTPHYIPILTVLNNLVANAVEAIVKHGSIKIHVFEEEDNVVFVVSDSGKGIPARAANIIFKPGFTTKFNEEGIAATGIGLSHVRDIVQSFGGEIRTESNDNAGGAAFIVRLPMSGLQKRGEVDGAFFHHRG